MHGNHAESTGLFFLNILMLTLYELWFAHRYPILLHEVLKHTPKSHADRPTLQKALE